jgi:hypothetical protein
MAPSGTMMIGISRAGNALRPARAAELQPRGMPRSPARMDIGYSLRRSLSFGRFCSAFRLAACHFPGRSSKASASSNSLVELASLVLAHLGQRRMGDNLLDPPAELGARHRQRLR